MTTPNIWKLPQVIDRKILKEGLINIRIEELELESGSKHTYYSIDPKGPAVFVLCLNEQQEFVLIEEYRHPTGKVLLSSAGGYIEKDEDILVAADRELQEETGYKAESYHLLGFVYPYPGLSSQRIYFVLGKNAKRNSKINREPLEIMRVLLKKEDDLYQEIAQGAECDGVFCSALTYYHIWKSKY